MTILDHCRSCQRSICTNCTDSKYYTCLCATIICNLCAYNDYTLEVTTCMPCRDNDIIIYLCINCGIKCAYCGYINCPQHYVTCGVCNNSVCNYVDECYNTCETCGKILCLNCVEGHQCY